MTGASSFTLPASTSCITEIAAKFLLTEPMLAAVVSVAVVPGPETVPIAWLHRTLSGETRAIEAMETPSLAMIACSSFWPSSIASAYSGSAGPIDGLGGGVASGRAETVGAPTKRPSASAPPRIPATSARRCW